MQPQPTETTLRPLIRALTEPVDDLARAAGRNEAEAERAYAILAWYRLRGVRVDPLQALRLESAAASRVTRGSTSIYMPGVNGRPGTVMNIPTTRPVLAFGAGEVVGRCIEVLQADLDAAESCGGAALFARLKPLWAAAKIDPRTTPEALAALTCDPAAVRPVSDAVAEAYRAEEPDRVVVLADRVIAVCGETGPSWPVRVVRAFVALDRKQPAEALRLLAPLPKPAPPPLGSSPSWTAMNAHAMLNDWAGYARERDALMAAAERTLTATGRAREPFRAAGWRVADFDVDLPASGISRRTRRVLLATPSDPRAAPRAFHLHHQSLSVPGLEALSGEAGWSLVEYQCQAAPTVKRWEGEAAPAPDAAEIRRLVTEQLAKPAEPASPDAGVEWTPGMCGFTRQIAPGV